MASFFAGKTIGGSLIQLQICFLISSDVVEKLGSFGLPWLHAHSDVAEISEALKDSPSLVSICAALLTHGKVEAAKRIQQAIAERPATKTHFHAWALKNNISL
ncbi:hypothetical protein [Chitinibacter tainanensis]|uniref:hypothetical protein n=1 Tax=Chitinibacter tainanensis TaxID=230667 RepID=UPI002357B13C|nr:hypothetical protein [Chitinibacter tainanensis]